MTDRPIIFSAPMIKALLAGTKTQTRRLAWTNRQTIRHSPWMLVQRGDRLWCRENIIKTPAGIVYAADGGDHYGAGGRLPITPCIHMPRWASRLTLTVTEVRRQRLQQISGADAEAEGIESFVDCGRRFWKRYRDGGCNTYVDCPIGSYASLWTELHGAGSWEANPEVVVLSLRCERRNIDDAERAADARAP